VRPVVWTLDARGDLINIIRYIARSNPVAAQGIRDRIDDCASQMVALHLGRRGRVQGTHELVVPYTRYIIAYRIRMTADRIEQAEILHVIHTARDWKPGEWPD
jgi:toxin ParE1/3/4